MRKKIVPGFDKAEMFQVVGGEHWQIWLSI